MYHTNKKRRSNLKTGIKNIEFVLPPNIAYVSILSSQKYVCDKCGKQFTEKRNLTRHMKSHVHSSQTYPCDVCEKEFKRADHRKRHEESHNYTITCPVCGQYFNRRESMLVTGLSTKDLNWHQWWRDLHTLDHPIILQSNHEVTVHSLPTVRLSVNHLSKMNPKSSQKTRRLVSYI